MTPATTQIADYTKTVFTAETSEGHSVSHNIYNRGSGTPVVLLQELPGIGRETLALADRLIDAGHEVVMPHLFGPIGKISIGGNLARVMCMRKEFRLMASNASSPISDWLRLLCREVRDSRGVDGVGVIGMCLTGNFAITLIGDDSVLAAVASQPAMPFFKQGALHMSPEEISDSRQALKTKGPMRFLRFEDDPLSTVEKSDCIHRTFNGNGHERVKEIVIPGKGHSVLTLDFVDEEGHPTREALDNVLAYFSARLSAPANQSEV
jgi:dienelactone hydrolase